MSKYKKGKKFFSKFRILLWKTVLMRKHSIIMTVMEIALPIVLCLQIRLMFQPTNLNIKTLRGYSKEHILSTIPEDTECWYTPKTTFVNDLMLRVSEKLRVQMHPADNEVSLVKSYFSNNASNKVLWSIFEIDEKASGKPKDLKYKIRSSEIGGNRMIMMLEEEPANEDPYLTSGFLSFQLAIESSFVEMWKSGLPDIGRTLNVSRFPFYKADFLIMPSVVRPNISVIYYATIAAFLLLPIATLQIIVHDKKTGLRGMMRLMDMSFSILYIGWLHHLMITLLPVTIACTIILYPVFTNSYAIVVAIFICMYVILSMFFMCAVGTFFSQSIKALLMAILFWFFMAHFAIVLDQILVNAPLIWRIMSLLLPHSGLLHGIVSFTSRSDFEDYHGEFMKRDIHRVKPHTYIGPYLWPKKLAEIFMLRDTYDIVHVKEKISISVILLVWIFHIIFWYLLTVYLDNINPGEFGSSKPWYYLCKKPKPNRNDELTYRGSTNWSAVERTPSSIKIRVLYAFYMQLRYV